MPERQIISTVASATGSMSWLHAEGPPTIIMSGSTRVKA